MLIGFIAVVLILILAVSQWKKAKNENFEDRDN